MSASQLATKFGISARTVQRIRQAGRNQTHAPEPKGSLQILSGDPEVVAVMQPALEWYSSWKQGILQAGPDGTFPYLEAQIIAYAVQAFEAFFLRYAGYDYLPEHAREWILEILSGDRLLLNVPPRHAKSEIVTVWLSVWLVCLDRNIQIVIISQTNQLAKKFSNKIAYLLEFHRTLLRDFGRFKPYDDQTAWRPLSGELMVAGRTRVSESGDQTIQIKGMGQGILGTEADIIIGDDVVDRKSSWSEAARGHLSESWHGDVMTRRSAISKVIVIGQCIHHEDLYAELGEKIYTRGAKTGKPVWRRVKYPAILDWDKETVLWPQEWGFDRLMETFEDLKRRGDAWLFEAMYQQNPIPTSARLIPPVFIYGDVNEGGTRQGCLDVHRGFGEGVTPEKGQQWIRAVSIDPSPERMTGIIVADVLHSRTDFHCGILEAKRARLNVGGMVDELERISASYRPQYLVFEQNAFARWFLQDPRFSLWDRKHGVRVIGHTTGRNKSDPNYGVQTLAHPFEFGRIRLPWGDPDAIASMKLLIEEATNFPFGTYTDLMMALWFLAYNFPKMHPMNAAGAVQSGVPGPGFRPPARLKDGFHWAKKRKDE